MQQVTGRFSRFFLFEVQSVVGDPLTTDLLMVISSLDLLFYP